MKHFDAKLRLIVKSNEKETPIRAEFPLGENN